MPSQAINGLKNNLPVSQIEADPCLEFMSTEVALYGIGRVQTDQLDGATREVTVCLIDSAYNLAQEDLPAGGNVTGRNDSGKGNCSEDGSGDGTHVTGTIAALSNDVGVVAVLPSGKLTIHLVKVFDNSGSWVWISAIWGGSSHTFRVCDADSGACSTEVVVCP